MTTSIAAAPDLFPSSPVDALKEQYVGKDLRDASIAGPQAVVDLAVVRRNCKDMLQTVAKLGVSFRAHVKTHKTTEVTRLQVGDGPGPVKLVVSTVAEAENLLPYLFVCKKGGREVNILYGIPPSASSIIRLRRLQDILGVESVSFLVDHESQLRELGGAASALGSTERVPVFIKVDSGYSRAGVTPRSKTFEGLVKAISAAQGVRLLGFYCHHGSSYGVSSSDGALEDLTHEIKTAMDAAATAKSLNTHEEGFVLSVGATPTATAAQNLMSEKSHTDVRKLIELAQSLHELELHAGVYPFLDLQQLATHARPSVSSGSPTMNASDIAMRVLCEVLSVYPERDKPEALVGAGCLALGREPCKSYPGWGVVSPSPWQRNSQSSIYSEDSKTGWIVGRVAQEHGILTWEGALEGLQQLEVGEKLLLWPNHACITASGYGWYLVVDSDLGEAERTRIVDVWARWRGW